METLCKDGPPDQEELHHSRQRRKQEAHAQKVLAELILYALYVFIVYAISYIGRDSRSFAMKNNIENTIDTGATFGFKKVTSRHEL